MPTSVVWYEDTPPSLNSISAYHGQGKYAKAKARWEGIFGLLALSTRLPKHLEWVRAEALLTFPDKRKRDEGNFRFILEKALGDALVKGGWLVDDDHSRYTFGKVTFSEEKGSKLTTITLDYELAGT